MPDWAEALEDVDRSGWGLGEHVREAHAILTLAKRAIATDSKRLVGTCVLFSGGNDSTVLTHLFRNRLDHVVHVNTGIGIKQTNQYVRDTCAGWGLDLIEKSPPPGCTYEELVLHYGFPGPGKHSMMYRLLKERALREVRRDFVKHGHRERLIYLTGIRRSESDRRYSREVWRREGSLVWVNPMIFWPKALFNAYRDHDNLPRNEVADLLHMSGECLCGAFAKPGELEEIALWFPETAAEIRALEVRVEAAGKPRCRWGQRLPDDVDSGVGGPLCDSCDVAGGRAS